MSPLNYLGLTLIALGGILFVRNLGAFWSRRALFRNAVRVKGQVVRMRLVEGSDSNDSPTPDSGKYYATVQYKTERRSYERELPPSRDAAKWKVGDTVRLIHERGNPANVIDAELRWADLISTAIASLVFVCIGVALAFFVVVPS